MAKRWWFINSGTITLFESTVSSMNCYISHTFKMADTINLKYIMKNPSSKRQCILSLRQEADFHPCDEFLTITFCKSPKELMAGYRGIPGNLPYRHLPYRPS